MNIRARLKLLEEMVSPDASLMGDSDLRRAMGTAWAEVEAALERIANGEDVEMLIKRRA